MAEAKEKTSNHNSNGTVDKKPAAEGRVYKDNLMTRVVPLERKSYFLDVRENEHGKYLKLSESSAKYRNTIVLAPRAVRILQQVLNDAIKENYTSEGKSVSVVPP